LGFGGWVFGFGVWGFGPTPKSPIPNPQSPIPMGCQKYNILINIYIQINKQKIKNILKYF
jgi:hypothetical protein